MAGFLIERLDQSQADLLAHPDFEQFDRLTFVVRHANPLVRAFGAAPHAVVSEEQVRIAIAGYIRSLVRFDARFDRYVRGDATALDLAERRGFNTFMGKGKCGTCHFVPLFGGTVPPTYLKTELEVLGVPTRPDTVNATVDLDPGAYRITRIPLHQHAFKTPSLRNVAVTGPYMHNGAYRTLEQVVDFYARGGGAGIGVDLPNQTLPPDPLRLTAREKPDLVAFMRSLTDTSGLGLPFPPDWSRPGRAGR